MVEGVELMLLYSAFRQDESLDTLSKCHNWDILIGEPLGGQFLHLKVDHQHAGSFGTATFVLKLLDPSPNHSETSGHS